MGTQGALPGFYERRELLFAAKPVPASLSAQGRIFLEAGLLDSALESFAMAGDSAGLAQVEAAARARGGHLQPGAGAQGARKDGDPADGGTPSAIRLSGGALLWFAYRAFEKAEQPGRPGADRSAMHAAGIEPDHF